MLLYASNLVQASVETPHCACQMLESSASLSGTLSAALRCMVVYSSKFVILIPVVMRSIVRVSWTRAIHNFGNCVTCFEVEARPYYSGRDQRIVVALGTLIAIIVG